MQTASVHAPKFNIVATGYILDGFALDIVRMNIVDRFKINKTMANRFLVGQPTIFKSNLNEDQVRFYWKKLNAIGLKVRIENAKAMIRPLKADLKLVSKNADLSLAERDHLVSQEAFENGVHAQYVTCYHCGTRQIKDGKCFKCHGNLAHATYAKRAAETMKRGRQLVSTAKTAKRVDTSVEKANYRKIIDNYECQNSHRGFNTFIIAITSISLFGIAMYLI